MADDLAVTEPIMLKPRRCFECGRWWAYESFSFNVPECPVCAGRTIERLRARTRELERSNASLRGAVTKAKEVR